MAVCSSCGGKGYNEGFINARLRHYYGQIKCSDCAGTGQVTEEQAERVRASKPIVLDRRARRVSIREEAARLGVDFAEWSRVEHGRMPETEAGAAAWLRRLEEVALYPEGSR